MRAHWLGALALLLAVSCVAPETRLRPDPQAQVLAGNREAAITDQQGVHLVADGDAWKGYPSDLERRLTPVYVRLENQSGRPLRVRYTDFSLVGGTSRFRYTALPPLILDGARASREATDSQREAIVPTTSWRMGLGYGYASRYGHFVGGYGTWGYGGPYLGWPWADPFYPGPYYWPYYYYTEPLPTEDMLTRALPEGTLEPGGVLDGFLYFQGVARRESAVTLQVQLVDASTGETFGTLDIPFQVRQG